MAIIHHAQATDFLVPIASIICFIVALFTSALHVYISINGGIQSCCLPNRYSIRRMGASSKVLFLSHGSMILNSLSILTIALTYFYPISEAYCVFYWKATTILYTYGLFSIKWTYEIRAYILFKHMGYRGLCSLIKGYFMAQCIISVVVSITMDLFLYGDPINDQPNGIPCVLSYHPVAVYMPIALMLIDATLLSLLTIKLIKIASTRQCINPGDSLQLKRAVCSHYVFTITCIAVCIVDFCINTFYMDYYLKLIAVVIDSLLQILCNFFMVNEEMELRYIRCLTDEISGLIEMMEIRRNARTEQNTETLDLLNKHDEAMAMKEEKEGLIMDRRRSTRYTQNESYLRRIMSAYFSSVDDSLLQNALRRPSTVNMR